MASLLSNYFGNAALNIYFTGSNTWLALHTNNPGDNGVLGTELAGGGYHRQVTKWTSPSNKTIATSTAQIFHDLPHSTIRYLGIWNSHEFGQMLVRFELATPVLVSASGQFISAIGDIAFTV